MDKNIRILYPILHYPPVIGGLEQWSQNIAENQPMGVQVVVVTGKVKGEPRYKEKSNVIIIRTSLFELRDLSHSSWLYIFTAIPLILFRSLIVIRREGISLLHCHGFISLIMGYILSAVSGKPFVGTEQSIGWARSRSGWLRGIIYRKAVICIAASQAVADEFRKLGVQKIKIIPNGVDLKKFTPSDRCPECAGPIKGGFTMLSVGRLEKVKGHEYLIEAFVEIKRVIPNARLILAGDGSERRSLEKQAATLGLSESVEFIGEVNHNDLPHYYHRAHIFIMPSISEGFGITSLEAMASGVPIIASRVGGLLDIIDNEKTGLTIEPSSSQAIARSVIYIAKNPDVARSLAEAGQKKAYNYSWEPVALQVASIYGGVSAGKRKRKILIITSIFPPEVGGPALYAKKLTDELSGIGNEVTVLSGRDACSLPVVFKGVKKVDLCYVLTSSPRILLPAFIASRLANRKIGVRLGGDFLWERAVEAGRTKLPLRLYYTQHRKSPRELIFFVLLRYIFKGLDFIIFNSDFQKEIYRRHYRIKSSKVCVIENPYPKSYREERAFPGEPLVVLYAGRLLELKNLEILIHTAADMRVRSKKKIVVKIIGAGPKYNSLKNMALELRLDKDIIFEQPVSWDVLLEKLRECWLVVVPSLSEVSPNFVFESCSVAAPVIVTKETGLPENIIENIITFDPKSKEELGEIMLQLTRPEKWQEYQKKMMLIDTARDFSEVARDHDIFFNARV